MSITAYEQDILDNVEKHGWFCTSVFDHKKREPNFSYSVGFIDSLKCAEFIVFGLPRDFMRSMLWSVFRQIRDGVSAPADGQRWSGVLEGHDCISRAVHPSRITVEYFNSALWYASHTGRERDSVQAFQLFWPSAKQNLFPWEAGCGQEVRDLQPLLYLPRDVGVA